MGTDPSSRDDAAAEDGVAVGLVEHGGLARRHAREAGWHAADDITGLDGKVNIDPATPANTLSGNPASGANRVLRGGSWNYAAGYCRSAFRSSGSPSNRYDNDGFRVICTAGLQ